MDRETEESLLETFVSNNVIELFIPKDSIDNDTTFEQEICHSERDDLFEDAAYLVVTSPQVTISLLHRKLKLNYNRAGRIIDQLEAAGIIGPFDGNKPREVKIPNIFALEQFLKDLNSSILNTNSISGLDLRNNREWNGERAMSYGLVEFFTYNYNLLISRCIQKYKTEEQSKIEEQDSFEKEKIKQKLLEKERKKRLHKEALNELIEDGYIFREFTNNERESISQDVIDRVWNRDGGRCVKCGSQDKLEFDHIIPHSKGGAATYRNLQLLCEKCNREKSNKIG